MPAIRVLLMGRGGRRRQKGKPPTLTLELQGDSLVGEATAFGGAEVVEVIIGGVEVYGENVAPMVMLDGLDPLTPVVILEELAPL